MSINEQAVSTLYSVSSLTLDIPALGLHLPVMDVLFTILVHYSYRSALGESHAYIGWGQGLVATLFMASGGGCTVSLIRGETFGLLQSNLTWAIHCFIYWAMFSNSFIYRCTQSLFEMPLGEHLFTLSDAVLRTSAMVQYGIEGVTANPGLGAGKSVAKIICGTLAGCGGGLWIDAFRLDQQHWSFCTPRLLRVMSVDMKLSLAITLFYMFMTSPELCSLFDIPVLTSAEAQAWGTFLMLGGLIGDTYSRRWYRKKESRVKEDREGKKE